MWINGDENLSGLQEFFSDVTLIGRAPVMSALKQSARQIAQVTSPLLIVGETGSGKESLARYIHQHSSRAEHPFIGVDCAALASPYLEKELFGYVKDAFPGAVRDSLGCIRCAHNGTLYLDDIHELAPRLESRLLGVLDQKSALPMGAVPSAARPREMRAETSEKSLPASIIVGRMP